MWFFFLIINLRRPSHIQDDYQFTQCLIFFLKKDNGWWWWLTTGEESRWTKFTNYIAYPFQKAENKAATHRHTHSCMQWTTSLLSPKSQGPGENEGERENQLGPGEAPSSCTAKPSGRAPPVTRWGIIIITIIYLLSRGRLWGQS